MTSSELSQTQLLFSLSGGNIAARATATADTLTLVGNAAADVTISGVADPALAQDAATKAYVDSLSVTPGTPNESIQYNNAGAFAGNAQLTYDGNLTMTVGAEDDGFIITGIDATTTNSAGSGVVIQGGLGDGTGVGGHVSILGNTGGTGAGADGGEVGIITGTGGSTDGTVGGVFYIQTGKSSATNGAAGSINLTTGAGEGTGVGGAILVTSGAGDQTGGTGNAGNITVTGGAGGATSGTGGTIQLKGGAATSSAEAGSLLFTSGASANTHTGFTFESNDGTDVVTILSASQDSTSTTTGTVRITGGLGVSQEATATVWKTSSDIRMKKDIERISDPLSKLKQIEGYTYQWKDNNLNKEGKRSIGVIAQQLESIGLGDIVSSGDEYKSVNYSALIPLIIEAIKELAKERE